MPESKVAVVGAGITGLAAAQVIQKKGIGMEVFEQHNYAGGSVKSIRQEGWLLEYGPNTLLLKDKKVADFLKEAGIWSKRIEANPQSSKRYIVKNGKLVRLPLSIVEALGTSLFSTQGKLRVLKEPFTPKSANREETVAAFVERRLGREILDYALNPFITGIYANRPEKLSLRHTFPVMHELEKKYGSLILGAFMRGSRRKKKERITRELISFPGGLRQLVDAAVAQINEICYNHEIKKVYKVDGQWYLKSTSGDHGPYSRVILNIPLYKWNENLLPVGREELEEIRSVEYPPLSVVHLGFRKEDVSHTLDGFGFLVPEKENLHLLGALFSSTLFPGRAPEGHHLITVFAGGGRQPELAGKESQPLLEIVMKDLKQLLGLKAEPVFKEHVFWPKSIPAYHVGYDRVLRFFQTLEERNPGLHICGNFRNGVSVPDCIKNGINLSEKLFPGN